uniref:Uncharacterized protein n=1 Tax=Oryza sativa subsp. japonica TaxID=39947 RepID=Q6ZDD7_ORYSJ|nr:hypothetical protein [Oryza sativa Japonica Group]
MIEHNFTNHKSQFLQLLLPPLLSTRPASARARVFPLGFHTCNLRHLLLHLSFFLHRIRSLCLAPCGAKWEGSAVVAAARGPSGWGSAAAGEVWRMRCVGEGRVATGCADVPSAAAGRRHRSRAAAGGSRRRSVAWWRLAAWVRS